MQFKIFAPVLQSTIFLDTTRAQTTATVQVVWVYMLSNKEVIKQAGIDIDKVAQKIVETKAGV